MEALQYYDMYSEVTTGRTPKQIKDSADKYLNNAINNQVQCQPGDDPSKVIRFDNLIPDKKTKTEKKVSEATCRKMLVALIVAKGNYTKESYWLYEKTQNVYVAFPDLVDVGKHGVVQSSLLQEISELASLKDTNLVKFLKRGGLNVIEKRKKFCFAKGCNLLQEGNKNHYDVAKKDIDIIIACMKDNQGRAQTDFSALYNSSLEFFVAEMI